MRSFGLQTKTHSVIINNISISVFLIVAVFTIGGSLIDIGLYGFALGILVALGAVAYLASRDSQYITEHPRG